MDKSIFDIQYEYLQTIEDLEAYFNDNPDAEGELPDEFNERLTVNANEASEKIVNYYYAIKSIESSIEVLKEEIARLAKKVKAKTRAIERIQEYAALGIKTFGSVPKGRKSLAVKTDKLTASFISLPKVVVTDIDEVLPQYLLYTVKLPIMDPATLAMVKPSLEELGIDFVTGKKLNTDKVKEELLLNEDNLTAPGLRYDNEAGYVRFS